MTMNDLNVGDLLSLTYFELPVLVVCASPLRVLHADRRCEELYRGRFVKMRWPDRRLATADDFWQEEMD